MTVNGCPGCLHKQRRIDELEEEVKDLRAKLRYQERRDEDGFFGPSTPSSKKPVKANTEPKDLRSCFHLPIPPNPTSEGGFQRLSAAVFETQGPRAPTRFRA
jgi:hypothetical protein